MQIRAKIESNRAKLTFENMFRKEHFRNDLGWAFDAIYKTNFEIFKIKIALLNPLTTGMERFVQPVFEMACF